MTVFKRPPKSFNGLTSMTKSNTSSNVSIILPTPSNIEVSAGSNVSI